MWPPIHESDQQVVCESTADTSQCANRQPLHTAARIKPQDGTNGRQRDTLRSLGLRGIGKTVERPDSEPLRGMVHAVRHLVVVEEKS